MPTLKNARQEQYVQGLASGLKQHAAYEKAGYRVNTRTVAKVNAARLASLPHVRARLAELQERQAKRIDVTVDDLIAELEEARLKAMATKQLNAAVNAILGKARLLGLLKDKVEVDMMIRKPMRTPGADDRMSIEEWKLQFAPKLLSIEGEPPGQPPKKGTGKMN